MQTFSSQDSPLKRAGTPLRSLKVIATGPLATVQDLGRTGQGALGVGHSGAADPASLRLANRLLSNPENSAAIEITFGGLEVQVHGDMYIALTGAPCPVTVGGRQAGGNCPIWVEHGTVVRIGMPASGLRSYLAVRGGIEAPEVLGSRSTDTLAALGPDPLTPGAQLRVGPCPTATPNVDLAAVHTPTAGDVTLQVVPGPRVDWFTPAAHDALVAEPYQVSAESNRIGMRLQGPVLERARHDELASEGMICGALQVPPSGQPTLFLADHPVTGGYPVIAVVLSADLGHAAQARPGQQLRFKWARTPQGANDDQ